MTATRTVLRAQLKALRRWGSNEPSDLSKIQQPVLVANGDSDRMVPTKNTHDLARRLPHSELIIYPDAGHAFQNPNNKSGYRADDTADAWQRTVSFLASTLKS